MFPGIFRDFPSWEDIGGHQSILGSFTCLFERTMAIQMGRDVATSDFTHFVSIDFETSGCGAAIVTKENPKDIKLFKAWEGIKTDAKCPTALLLDPSGQFVSFGHKAKTSYEMKSLPNSDKANDYLLFHKFKIHLYETPVRVQWNPSKTDTIWEIKFVLCKEVFFIRGL